MTSCQCKLSGDLEADAAGGAGDDEGDAVERGKLERVGEVAGGELRRRGEAGDEGRSATAALLN